MYFIADCAWDAYEEFCEDRGLDINDASSREESVEYSRDMEEDRLASYRD